jgi:hypothetical protein
MRPLGGYSFAIFHELTKAALGAGHVLRSEPETRASLSPYVSRLCALSSSASIQGSDDVSLTKGAHSVKFGANVVRMRDNILAISNPGGEFAFSQMSDFLANRPFSLSAAIPSAVSERGFRQAYFDPNPRRNYLMQWNLTVARDLTRNVSLRVGYVGSRGVHQLFRVEDADIVLPSLTFGGYLWPSPVGSGTRLNVNAGLINAGLWQGNSFYDARQMKLKAKIGGAEIEGSYTWGKTIDTSSGSLVGDEYSNSTASPLWFNTKLNRGRADFNVAHNVELNYTWEIGTPKWAHGVRGWALSGWEIGGVFEASAGVPFTPGFGGDALGVERTDPNVDVPDVLSGPGCGSLVYPGNPNRCIKTQCFGVPNPITLRGNLGRNTLIGPGLVNFDLSLFKNNRIQRISDTFNVQFRAEFFNVVNHTNFAPPLDNRNIFDSSGSPIGNAGLITSTQTPSREIQLAAKVIW